jgi:CBS domain-containing protein
MANDETIPLPVVADVMTTPVVTIAASASILDAARLMLAKRISGLPVVGPDGGLVGIVTEGDFLVRGELGTAPDRSPWLDAFISPGKLAAEYVHSHSRRVEEIMSPDVVTAGRDEPLSAAVEVMTRHQIKRLPVIANGRLIGIIARSDLLRALLQVLAVDGPEPAGDAQIRAAILDELGRQSWTIRGLIRVDVADGAVELSGPVFDERERQGIRVAVENVPGVVSVVDRMLSIEPISGMAILPEERAAALPDAVPGRLS